MNETIARFAWPHITGEDAQLGNRLYGMSGRVALDVEGKRFRVSFLPAFRAPYAPSLRAVLGIEDRRAVLDLEQLPLPELLGFPGGGLDPRDLPAEVLRSYLEGVLGGVLDLAGRALGRPVSLVDAGLAAAAGDAPDGDAADADARTVHLEFESEGPDAERLRARLHLGPEEYAALAKALPQTAHAPEEWAGLPVPVRFRVGTAPLALGELEALGRGDIVLLAADPLAPGGMRMCAGDKDMPLWTATWSEGLVSIDKECEVEIEEKGGSQGGDPDKLEALEVLLTFDLGGRMATLGEIRGLAAGTIFELPENPDARVGIRVGGKQIGTGSLIMVDGRAGVRVDSLWNGKQP